MPQLMPLYWILSTMMILLFLMMVLKLYANYNINFMEKDNEIKKLKKLWYW